RAAGRRRRRRGLVAQRFERPVRRQQWIVRARRRGIFSGRQASWLEAAVDGLGNSRSVGVQIVERRRKFGVASGACPSRRRRFAKQRFDTDERVRRSLVHGLARWRTPCTRIGEQRVYLAREIIRGRR